MDAYTYKLYKLQCQKSNITSIFIRVLIAFAIIFFSNSATDTNKPIGSFIMYYVMISWFWIFVRITGNWILGFFTAWLVPIFIISKVYDKFKDNPKTVEMIVAVLFLAVIVIDVISLGKYFILRASILKDGFKIRKLSREEMRSYRAESRRR